MKNYNQQTRTSTPDTLNLLYTVQDVQDTLHFKNAIYMVILLLFPGAPKISQIICFFPGIGVCGYTKINKQGSKEFIFKNCYVLDALGKEQK